MTDKGHFQRSNVIERTRLCTLSRYVSYLHVIKKEVSFLKIHEGINCDASRCHPSSSALSGVNRQPA